VLTREEIRDLVEHRDLRSVGSLVVDWGLVAASFAAVARWPNPITVIVALFVIGARQLGLAILMHDAAHGCLHADQRVNDWVGEWLCAAPVGADLSRYRPYHLKHHKYTEQPEDPDLSLSAPFPISRKSLWRKVVRDLTGQTFFKQRIGPMLAKRGEGRRVVLNEGSRRFWITNAILFAACAAAGIWWAYFALWIVSMATWLPLVTRLRNIAEHACVPRSEDPFRHARTTQANPIEGLLIAPYWVNYHAEHHMFMHLPCWSLPKAHALLAAKGHTSKMITAPSYPAVLREAALA